MTGRKHQSQIARWRKLAWSLFLIASSFVAITMSSTAFAKGPSPMCSKDAETVAAPPPLLPSHDTRVEGCAHRQPDLGPLVAPTRGQTNCAEESSRSAADGIVGSAETSFETECEPIFSARFGGDPAEEHRQRPARPPR